MQQGGAVFLLLLAFSNSILEFGNGDGGDTDIRNAKGLEFIQYFLGFLLDEVNADIGIKQVLHLEVLSGVKEWLIYRIHEVIGEIV